MKTEDLHEEALALFRERTAKQRSIRQWQQDIAQTEQAIGEIETRLRAITEELIAT